MRPLEPQEPILKTVLKPIVRDTKDFYSSNYYLIIITSTKSKYKQMKVLSLSFSSMLSYEYQK